jgi:hypothetical protein
MADRHRIVTFSPGGRPVVELDLNDMTVLALQRLTFKAPALQRTALKTQSGHRFGGSRVVAETHDNGTAEATWLVMGATADASLLLGEQLLSSLLDPAPGRYYEWRPDGATRSVYMELRGPGIYEPQYEWPEFAGAQVLKIDCKWEVAPLSEWDRMDIADPFDVDSIADYTVDAGANVSVSGGALITSSSNLTVEKQLIHTARGYQPADAQATIKTSPGAVSSYKSGVILRRVDASNRLEAYVDDNGTNSRLRVDKVIAGTRTNLASTNLGSRITTTAVHWVRGRVEGGVVYAEHWTGEPTPAAAATTSTSVVLSAAERAVLTSGYAGIVWVPQNAASTIDDFTVEPYTYKAASGVSLPLQLPLGGAIPGDGPAKTDLWLTSTTPGVQPWAMFAWWERAQPFSRLWNGSFERDTNGWAATVATNINNPSTSITRITSASKYGTAAGAILTPGSLTIEGANFRLPGVFRAGVSYTLSLWAKLASGTNTGQARLGASASADLTALDMALTTSWQQFTLTWIPSADRSDVYVAAVLGKTVAFAGTLHIDGVVVYEGAVAPATGKQAEGAGAVPPVGIIEGESLDVSLSSGFATTADAGCSGGSKATAAITGAQTVYPVYYVDPQTLAGDDFSVNEVRVEVWARLQIPSTLVSPTVYVQAAPEGYVSELASIRYTEEYGNIGKPLTVPSGTRWQMVRLGVLALSVDRGNPQRARILPVFQTAAGTTGTLALDYLMLVPVRQRALSPTGKALDSTYPQFMYVTTETTKRVRSDLTGASTHQDQPGVRNQLWPEQGLTGQMLELPAGDVDVLVDLSNKVPDDPADLSGDETFPTTATVHLAVVPRSYLSRGN